MNILNNVFLSVLTIIIMTLIPVQLDSQSNLDSLLKELETNYNAEILYSTAKAYFTDSLDKAGYYADKALTEVRKEGNKKLEIRILLLQGDISSLRDETNVALKFYMEALEKSGNLKDKKTKSRINYSIGRIYAFWNKYPEAIPFLKRALDYAINISDISLIAIINNQLAECYLYLDKIDSARFCLKSSYNSFISSGDSVKAIGVLVNFATVLHELNDFKEALTYELRALDLYRQISASRNPDFNITTVSLFVNLGHTYRELGEYDKALKFSNEGLKFALINDMLQWQMLSYENISVIYSKVKKFKMAYEFLQKYNITRDSLFNLEKHQQISELEAKYKSKQNEHRIQLLEKESRLQKILLISGSLLIFLISD